MATGFLIFVSGCGGGSSPTQIISTPDTTEVQPTAVTTDQAVNNNQQTNTLPNDNEPSQSDNHNDDHSIRYTDSNADIWPPQPVDITDIAAIQRTGNTNVSGDKTAKEMALVTSDAVLLKSLGKRFEMLAKHEIRNKANQLTSIETEFYAYDTNQVVTVTFDPDRKTVIDRSIASASSYQPPESQQEVQKAIALASDALSAQGFTQHKRLLGTGLLAYPTATEVANNGNQFFSARKIYVTFGHGNGELPKFRALVNLSTKVVETSGAIQ